MLLVPCLIQNSSWIFSPPRALLHCPKPTGYIESVQQIDICVAKLSWGMVQIDDLEEKHHWIGPSCTAVRANSIFLSPSQVKRHSVHKVLWYQSSVSELKLMPETELNLLFSAVGYLLTLWYFLHSCRDLPLLGLMHSWFSRFHWFCLVTVKHDLSPRLGLLRRKSDIKGREWHMELDTFTEFRDHIRGRKKLGCMTTPKT